MECNILDILYIISYIYFSLCKPDIYSMLSLEKVGILGFKMDALQSASLVVFYCFAWILMNMIALLTFYYSNSIGSNSSKSVSFTSVLVFRICLI